MSENNSVKHVTLNLPASDKWVQLPSEDAQEITILNNTDNDLGFKQLPNPALQPYSFKNYNSSLEKTAQYGVGGPGILDGVSKPKRPFGDISTIESGSDTTKIIESEDSTTRMATYTKLNEFTNKTDLDFKFDFYSANDLTSVAKISEMTVWDTSATSPPTRGQEPNLKIPILWEWGTSSAGPGTSYSGGIGTRIFENQNWKVFFFVDNVPPHHAPEGSNTLYRLTVHQIQSNLSAAITSGSEQPMNSALKRWQIFADWASYNSQTSTLSVAFPIYKLANMEINQAVYISIDRLSRGAVSSNTFSNYVGPYGETTQQDANRNRLEDSGYISKITPFQKVILRGERNERSEYRDTVKPYFINDSAPLNQCVLNSVTRYQFAGLARSAFSYDVDFNPNILVNQELKINTYSIQWCKAARYPLPGGVAGRSSYLPSGSWMSNTNAYQNHRLLVIENPGNDPYLFRATIHYEVKDTVTGRVNSYLATSNTLVYDPIINKRRDEALDSLYGSPGSFWYTRAYSVSNGTGFYGITRRSLGENSCENHPMYLAYESIPFNSSTELTSGSPNSFASLGFTNGTIDTGNINKTCFARIDKFNPNYSINFFAFAKWLSKPYPEGFPFSEDPNLEKDAYRFSINLYNETINLYYGNVITSKVGNIQKNLYPYFTDLRYSLPFSNENICNSIVGLGNRGYRLTSIASALRRNSWNTVRVIFNMGNIRLLLNNHRVLEITDPLFRERSDGNYVGITTNHIADQHLIGRYPNFGLENFGAAGSRYANNANVKIRNYQINYQNNSNISDVDLALLPSLKILAQTGSEINGISNANQIFLRNLNPNRPITISYRIVK